MSEGVLFPAPRDPAQPFWDPGAQTMDAQRRRALQDQRVRDLVTRTLARPVPFFARKLSVADIEDARDVNGVEDLAAIPVTVKQELRDSEQANPPIGDYRYADVAECVRMGTSTGTTGVPTIRLWTRHDLWVEYESAARHWWRNGWRPGMSITHAHPGYLYGGGLLLQGAYEYFGFLAIWVPPPETDEAAEQGIRTWMRMRPDIPFGHYSVGRFCEVATKLGLDPLTDVGLERSHYPGPGAEAPLTSGGSECYAFVASPCHQSPGGHVNEDWAVIEAIDPVTGRPVPDGEWGSLTLTTLDRDNPLLRYDLEESVKLLRDPCPCGETTVRALWGGRVAHLLHAQGQSFQVADVERALLAVPEVAAPSLEFVVVRPTDADAAVVVRVERGEVTGDADRVRDRCAAVIREGVGVRVAIELVERGSLPRSGYKAVRLVEG
jgi:phenylacetate-CoA ligase